MDRIVLVPEEMERAAATLRHEAARLRDCGDHVSLAAHQCCAPVGLAGALVDAAAAVRARALAVADALDDDARELDQRATLARMGQQLSGRAAGTIAAHAPTSDDPAIVELAGATLAAIAGLLQQLLAGAGAVPPTGAPSVMEALAGGTFVGGTDSFAHPGTDIAPTTAVIGGNAPLGLSIIPGNASPDILGSSVGSSVVGGSWSATATDAIGYIATPGPMVTVGGTPSARMAGNLDDLMARMVIVPQLQRDLALAGARNAIANSNLLTGTNRDASLEVGS